MEIADIILISMGLLTIAMIAAGLLRNFSMPYSVVLVVIGIILAELSRDVEAFAPLQAFTLTPELVFFIFLPALIFESGLSLDARQLMKDIAPVLTLAVPALLISTSVIGLLIWMLLDFDLAIALLFGALISATDPVAVVALFKELGAPLRLNVLVEGESLFNDATAIVVFGILLEMALGSGGVGFANLGGAVVEFMRVFVGGTLVGVLIGLLVSEMLFRLKSQTSAILTMSMVTAYSSFIVAEHYFHVSGVMATVGAALALSIYGLTRIPLHIRPVVSETWEFVGMVANSLLFLLVGLSIDAASLLEYSGIILVTVLIVSAARAVSVYSMVPLTVNLFNLPKVSLAERHIMWWGGLKGGLAIAIALSIPESIPGRELLINMTLGVVLFSLLVNAWSIRPLMHRLRLDILDEDEQAELERELNLAEVRSSSLLEQYRALGVLSRQLGERLDYKIRELFKNDAGAVSPKQARRRVFLFALKTEIDALNQLYGTGIIDQYTLMDIRNNLQIDREGFSRYESNMAKAFDLQKQTVFRRFEQWVIRHLREKNWAAGILSKFQSNRLDRSIQRQVAGIVMSNLVIERLVDDGSLDEHEKQVMTRLHEKHLEERTAHLQSLREDFADMFAAIENRMFTRAALIAAKVDMDSEFHHGEIGVKAYNRISQLIGHILAEINREKISWPDHVNLHIANVDLFRGLSHEAVDDLCAHVQEVTFLPGDLIIEEGDRGDALYVLKSGTANVTKLLHGRYTSVLQLKAGDFFGEMALLGDHVRTATVTAESAVVTYRLTHDDVLKVAARNDEVRLRLEKQRDERLAREKTFH